jgi:hypothetical protein
MVRAQRCGELLSETPSSTTAYTSRRFLRAISRDLPPCFRFPRPPTSLSTPPPPAPPASQTTSLKLKHTATGEIRRVTLPEMTLEMLHKHAAAAFGAPLEKLTFVDADGDIVTISTLDDLAYAAANATGRELLLHGVFAAAVAAAAAAAHPSAHAAPVCVPHPPPPVFRAPAAPTRSSPHESLPPPPPPCSSEAHPHHPHHHPRHDGDACGRERSHSPAHASRECHGKSRPQWHAAAAWAQGAHGGHCPAPLWARALWTHLREQRHHHRAGHHWGGHHEAWRHAAHAWRAAHCK